MDSYMQIILLVLFCLFAYGLTVGITQKFVEWWRDSAKEEEISDENILQVALLGPITLPVIVGWFLAKVVLLGGCQKFWLYLFRLYSRIREKRTEKAQQVPYRT